MLTVSTRGVRRRFGHEFFIGNSGESLCNIIAKKLTAAFSRGWRRRQVTNAEYCARA
jgi:hypothetical protein